MSRIIYTDEKVKKDWLMQNKAISEASFSNIRRSDSGRNKLISKEADAIARLLNIESNNRRKTLEESMRAFYIKNDRIGEITDNINTLTTILYNYGATIEEIEKYIRDNFRIVLTRNGDLLKKVELFSRYGCLLEVLCTSAALLNVSSSYSYEQLEAYFEAKGLYITPKELIRDIRNNNGYLPKYRKK